jgi:hypothetical protein
MRRKGSTPIMATPKKAASDRAAGEMLFTEVFKLVEQLNATAGLALAEKGVKSGNMTFNPKIILDAAGEKQYTCYVDIYTPQSAEMGPEISMEWGGTSVEQFKKALTTVAIALSSLAREAYLSDTYTVALIKPDGEEAEIYAPETLEPGMYSIKEV